MKKFGAPKSDSEITPKKKKKFQKPKIVLQGNLMELSQTSSAGGPGDGGAAPFDRMGMCLTPVPDIVEHKWLVSDSRSQNRFREVISKTVKPGDVVLDLGCGTGIHTLFALQSGARQVYAVDANAVIDIARTNIERNGFSDEVIFIRSYFENLVLPEKVDVILSNLGFLNTLVNLPRVAHRHLKPKGKTIPEILKIYMSPVSAPQIYEQNLKFWNEPQYQLDFSGTLEMAQSSPHYSYLLPDQILSAGQEFALSTRDERKIFNFNVQLEATRAGACHGIGGWYDFATAEGTYLSTRPPHDLNKEIWTNFVFPLPEPVLLRTGDCFNAQMTMNIMNPWNPVWTWKAQVNGRTIANQSNLMMI